MNHTKSESAPMLFIVGLAIGAVAAALLTPKKGEDMRRDLKQGLDNMKERAKQTSETARNTASEKIEDAKNLTQKGKRKEGQGGSGDNTNDPTMPAL